MVVGLLLLLLLGDQGPWLPFRWIVTVPELRWLVAVPSRLSVIAVMVFALVFGQALDALIRRRLFGWSDRRWQLVSLAVVSLVTADLLWVSQGQWRPHPFAGDPIEREDGPFALALGDRGSQYQLLMHNQGTIRCHEIVPVHRSSRLRPGVRPQLWLEPLEAGSVSLERFSPNRLWIDVEAEAPATVVVNQNSAPGWSVHGEIPAKVTEVEGLLALEVPASRGRLELRYRAPGLTTGLALAGATLVGVAIVFLGRRWRRRQREAGGRETAAPGGLPG